MKSCMISDKIYVSFYCDICGKKVKEVHEYWGKHYCIKCLGKKFPKVELEKGEVLE